MLRGGQSAVEFLSVIALGLAILIPTAYYVLNYAGTLQSQAEPRQAILVGSKLTDAVNEVYASEQGSFVTLDLQLPQSYSNATIRNASELHIEIQTRNGPTDLLFFSQYVNITNGTDPCTSKCTLPFRDGQNRVRIENVGDLVNITEP